MKGEGEMFRINSTVTPWPLNLMVPTEGVEPTHSFEY